MKNLIKFFILCILLMLSISCINEQRFSSDLLSEAKYHFESSAISLSIPMMEQLSTKSHGSSNDIYPDWKKAIKMPTDSSELIEVPLVCTRNLIGAIVESHEDHIHYRRALCNSFLVIEYTKSYIPKIFIATIIEQGLMRSSSFVSRKSNFKGFIIISDLNGNISENISYNNGIKRDFKPEIISPKNISKKLSFYGFKIAEKIAQRGGGENTNGEEGWMGSCTCSKCGEVYCSAIWSDCPNCGFNEFYIHVYCSKCSQLLKDCICDSEKVCPYCNRIISLCTCEDNNKPGETNPADTCLYCGSVVGTCEHTIP